MIAEPVPVPAYQLVEHVCDTEGMGRFDAKSCQRAGQQATECLGALPAGPVSLVEVVLPSRWFPRLDLAFLQWLSLSNSWGFGQQLELSGLFIHGIKQHGNSPVSATGSQCNHLQTRVSAGRTQHGAVSQQSRF